MHDWMRDTVQKEDRVYRFVLVLLVAGTLSGFCIVPAATASSSPASGRSPALDAATILTPPPGSLYHAAYTPPKSAAGVEDIITNRSIRSYEQAVGKKVAWVYFSDEWANGREFPLAIAIRIRANGAVPFIRLMLRSDANGNHADPLFTLDQITAGDFDPDLRAWAGTARDFGTPVLVEYGTEVNGKWFPWNGFWNNETEGPAKFRDAYRHIVAVMDGEGASNLVWVFHVNDGDWPETSWNLLENYYPGDDVVDWIGVSVYGPQTPYDRYRAPFRAGMDAVYPRLCALNATKPIALLEFGVAAGNPQTDQGVWARRALRSLVNGRYPRVIGFSWWNEFWENDGNPARDTNMRVQDNPELRAAFRKFLPAANVIGRPVTG